MTKKDFELIAAIFAKAERNSGSEGRAFLYAVVDLFAVELAKDHPRFKPELFKTASLPIMTKEV